jgi:cyclohexadienyl dehydratase
MLRVGLPGDYAPFALVDARGTLEGADIELAKRIAATLGVELRFIRTSWPTLIADLESGRYDVALGGITVTAERAQHGGFSAAYHHGGKTIVARCADRARFDTLAELEHGARVIVNPGGTNERFVRTHLPAANVEVFADNTAIPAELLARRADAMITDDIEADLWSSRHPGLCRATQATFTADQKAALTVRDQALRSRIDEIMVPLVAAGVPARLLDVAIRQSH